MAVVGHCTICNFQHCPTHRVLLVAKAFTFGRHSLLIHLTRMGSGHEYIGFASGEADSHGQLPIRGLEVSQVTTNRFHIARWCVLQRTTQLQRFHLIVSGRRNRSPGKKELGATEPTNCDVPLQDSLRRRASPRCRNRHHYFTTRIDRRRIEAENSN